MIEINLPPTHNCNRTDLQTLQAEREYKVLTIGNLWATYTSSIKRKFMKFKILVNQHELKVISADEAAPQNLNKFKHITKGNAAIHMFC